MKLLVLAGGFGSRLKSMLPSTPKALAPIGDLPFLALQIENWVAQGVCSFVFLLHHQADQIINFLDGVKSGLLNGCEVQSLIEPTPMDTGGAVAYAVREMSIRGDFIVTNADTWLSSGIQELRASVSPAIAAIKLDDPRRYGRVHFDERQLVTEFMEKDPLLRPGWVNAGLSRLSADLFQNWDGDRFSLERQTFPELVRQGKLRVVNIESDFIDIGIPEDYQRFCGWVKAGSKDKL